MFAPIIIPIVCLNVSNLALIKTMAMIITAEDESNIVVKIVPVMIAENRFFVNFKIQILTLSPAKSVIVEDKLLTAKRNNTKPANSDKITSNILQINELKVNLELPQSHQNNSLVKCMVTLNIMR